MNEFRVANWNELNERLYQKSWNEPLKRFRPSQAYRGLNNVAYGLETSLKRLGGQYRRREGDLLRNFRKYARRDSVHGDSLWIWLAVAQHYGLPTRLLDWTHSPYVALHFATEDLDQFSADGVIWCVDYHVTNR